ncbi:probable peptidyl-tRNA hydrolase isoform X1 [Talpa occidentalis]|uniref:probable peptidyl-tRNA hydrolase isoform X1 n=1 Tax=Talpa occidentalis TaxID=50954 RepID=UPI00188E7DA6|nr:probable peptidyl-tRNA hydrolase isoform X1 [Talpa occidentalis]
MPPPGLSGAGLRLGRAMSRGVLEPRPPGKRWLVAGLGNPGLPGTRHSVGLAVLGQLARRLGVAGSWARDRRCAADLALAALGDAQLVLLRPRRLMNANGLSVARAAELFGLTAEEVYLVHDELDKPLGKLALKLGGSARRCPGSGWALGARHAPRRCRPTCWASSPPRSRSCCHRCWSGPPTCSWTTSASEARVPPPAPDPRAPCAHTQPRLHIRRGATPTCGIHSLYNSTSGLPLAAHRLKGGCGQNWPISKIGSWSSFCVLLRK